MMTPQCREKNDVARLGADYCSSTPNIEVPSVRATVRSPDSDLIVESPVVGLPTVGPSTLGPPKGQRKLRALIVEDDSSDVELVRHALETGGFDVECDVVETAAEFTAQIRKENYELVLADYRLPMWHGIETVEILCREGLDIPVIMVSGSLGELTAVECLKQGASDYALKDHLERLPSSVGRALREKSLRDAHRRTQEELARSNRDLEQFAYVASHDLQEPLRMVAAYTQLLAERYRGKLDANADKYIHYAVDGALRMQTLVQDLLAFSRVGRNGWDPRPVDMNELAQLVLANLQATIQGANARVEYQQLPKVVADPTQMLQLLQNLIGNALKFRGAEVPQVSITAKQEEREWIFSVADNGIGIAPEHAETVFVIFKRLHTHSEYSGSGIGLAICKKIVEQHGGRIWVESQPGRGSSFKFTIPLTAARRDYDHCSEN